MQRSFIREILEHTTPETISFAGGLPDPALFPLDALRQAACRALHVPESLQYSVSTGHPPLREKIAARYTAKGFRTDPEQILITSGSQQALDIVCRCYGKEAVTVEQPSYLGAINLFRLNRLRTEAVPLSHEGPDPEAFARSVRRTRTAYLIPDFQNPTGRRHTLQNRVRIAETVEKEQAYLIEDAPYSELWFDTPLPPVAGMIPDRSFHLGSFSKTLAPGLRLGWIRTDRALMPPLVACREAMDLHTGTLVQQIVSRYLDDEDALPTHLRTLRKVYREKMHRFADILQRRLPSFRFRRPDGGMFIYGSLPGTDTAAVLRECLKNGVVFVPGIEFEGKNDEIRFNFTRPDTASMEKGIAIIAETVRSAKRTG